MEKREVSLSADKTIRVKEVLAQVIKKEDWLRGQRQGRGEASEAETRWKFARQVLEIALGDDPNPVVNDGSINAAFDLGGK